MNTEELKKKSLADLITLAGMFGIKVPNECTKKQVLILMEEAEKINIAKAASAEAKTPSADAKAVNADAKEANVQGTENAKTAKPRKGKTIVVDLEAEAKQAKEVPAEADQTPKAEAEAKPVRKDKKSHADKKPSKIKESKSDSEVETDDKTQNYGEEPSKSNEPDTLAVEIVDSASKQQTQAKREPEGEQVSGLLDILQDGYGFLRIEGYIAGSKDVYVAPNFIRKYALRTGDEIVGRSRMQRDNEKYRALCFIETINGMSPSEASKRIPFENLTPVYPEEKINLETVKTELATRIIDLMAPIGKGQRGMIVSPPKAGKTILLKKIANAITENHPDIHLIVLLIDERPEEVTDMRESIDGEVVSSTFDEMPERHTKVAEMVFERARRLVEMGKDVVILMDSLTRLARAYNITITPTGRSLSGGLDPGALFAPKRFFGAARNIRGGGSLTIVATALVDTGSKMDDVIYEEFKGTGNMEIHLDRKLSEKRIFPAIDIQKSGTRKEELLLTPQEADCNLTIRKAYSGPNAQDFTEVVIEKMLKSSDNNDFISLMKYNL